MISFSFLLGICGLVRVNSTLQAILRFINCSSSWMSEKALAAWAASRALAAIGISTRSDRAMAREAMRLAVPSRSMITNWRIALSESITGTILLSLISGTITAVVSDMPVRHALRG